VSDIPAEVHCDEFSTLEWQSDPAASGMRWRVWVKSPDSEPAELFAYEDGRWGLSMPRRQYPYIDYGEELTLDEAKRSVFDAWKERMEGESR